MVLYFCHNFLRQVECHLFLVVFFNLSSNILPSFNLMFAISKLNTDYPGSFGSFQLYLEIYVFLLCL